MAVGRQFRAAVGKQLTELVFQLGPGAVVLDDPVGPSGFVALGQLSRLPSFKPDLPPGLGPLPAYAFVGNHRDGEVEPLRHLALEQQRHLHDRDRAIVRKGLEPATDLDLDQRVDLLLQPRQLGRVAEDTLTYCRTVDHPAGFDRVAPALLQRRQQRLTVEQVVNDPVGRDGGGTETPEGLESRRLAGGDAAGQSDG